ncbi:acyl-CoA dehydrogenase family protein [Embleya scabrispora]|uniref:acyl-CoA dehydrogenase family protein n=1 Tax=Embleya scabrispora TaxID=159449 RepID=UPI0003634713|nr:acyl-CoA dehydrogenase family protein [Embleya scabrispora]MYS79274.1 indole dioxygenase [Streptomyces sp. SID5474]
MATEPENPPGPCVPDSGTEHLVRAAADLVPRLLADAPKSRALARLTDEVVHALAEAGLVTALAPRSRGGSQVPLGDFVRIQEELARGCGSTSWVTGVYAAALYMLSAFTDEAQDEVYATATPKSVAAFKPEGMAGPASGGYRLTGTWRFCSGQHHADWALLSSILVIDDVPQPAQFLIPRSDWVSADDWEVTGLSGTGSATLSVDDAFVPEHRVLPLTGPPRSVALAGDPYFSIPFIPLFVTGATGTPLGLARAAVDLFGRRIRRRGITYTPHERQAEATVTHLQLDTMSMKLEQARFHAQRAVATVPLVTEDPDNAALRVRCRADAAWATKLCQEAIAVVREGSGASAIGLKDPLSLIVGDIDALALHSFLLHSSIAELHGRVLAGLEPGVPYL